MPKISVIISTYNQPKWLEKCLWSYDAQTFRDFEVVIADDGSGSETRDLITRLQQELSFPIKHVWHEDDGFQKCSILNKATTEASHEYLLFTDGDCLARADILAFHAKHAETGFFLSGAYFKMTLPVSEAITREDIVSQKIFRPSYLEQQGQRRSHKMLKLGFQELFSVVLDALTTTKATWNGHCSSGWKADILAVNGHNENMQYGGQDRELGERLLNYGIKSKQIRHRSCMLHLDHPGGYKSKESIDKNKAIRKQVRQRKVQWAPNGIKKIASEAQFKTYLINLDRSPERLKHSDDEFKKYALEYERIKAIDGQSLDIKDYPQSRNNCAYYHLELRINEIACYLSHIKCLERFLESDAQHALIMEDDFAFKENPIPCLNTLTHVEGWDVIKLYRFNHRKLKTHIQSFKAEHDGDFYNLEFCASTPICNTSQFFTRAGAEKFLRKKNFLLRPVDVDLKHYWERDLKILSICPSLTTEHEETQQFSTIGHDKPKSTTSSKAKKISYTLSYQSSKWWHYWKNS